MRDFGGLHPAPTMKRAVAWVITLFSVLGGAILLAGPWLLLILAAPQ